MLQDNIENNKIFIRVYYDIDDLKKVSIWYLSLVSEYNGESLYIETHHDDVSNQLPKEKFNELKNISYFMGLVDADAKINCSIKDFDLNNEIESKVNIFTNTKEKIIQKIISFIKENSLNENLTFIFKNSFEEVLFNDLIKEKINEIKNDSTMFINLNNFIITNEYQYENIIKEYINKCVENNSFNNKEEELLFNKLRIVIETFIMRDYFEIMMREV